MSRGFDRHASRPIDILFLLQHRRNGWGRVPDGESTSHRQGADRCRGRCQPAIREASDQVRGHELTFTVLMQWESMRMRNSSVFCLEMKL